MPDFNGLRGGADGGTTDGSPASPGVIRLARPACAMLAAAITPGACGSALAGSRLAAWGRSVPGPVA